MSVEISCLSFSPLRYHLLSSHTRLSLPYYRIVPFLPIEFFPLRVTRFLPFIPPAFFTFLFPVFPSLSPFEYVKYATAVENFELRRSREGRKRVEKVTITHLELRIVSISTSIVNNYSENK